MDWNSIIERSDLSESLIHIQSRIERQIEREREIVTATKRHRLAEAGWLATSSGKKGSRSRGRRQQINVTSN